MSLGKVGKEVSEALSVLKNESLKPDSHKAIKRLFTVKYPARLDAKNDHDSLTKLIYLQDYISKIDSEEKPISETQAKVLAFYAINGNCDKDTRKDLAIMLNKDIKNVHLYNHTLVALKYLEKSGYKSGSFVFSDKFKKLQQYWQKCKETKDPLTFLVEIDNKY